MTTTTIASLPDRSALWLALLQAAACAVAALTLAAHYPLSPLLAILAVLAAGVAAARFWTRTPLLLGLLPLIGFAPWSGWITFEELDMLVLAVAAGAYAALALRMPPQERAPAWRHNLSYSPLARLLLLLYGVALLVGMQRGFADAGGFVFGWFQGYHEPMNSLRLTKSFFLAALLLPPMVHAGATRPREAARALLLGMVLALAGMSGAALWERLANTALLDFSTDYRSTALFWEMHVGGAALDGGLAMTLPFAALALLRARSPRSFLLLMALLMLASYAALTTFSRGVYLAVPVSLAVLVLLRGLQRRRAVRSGGGEGVAAALMSVPPLGKLGGLLLMAAFAGAAALMFEGSGYRGQLALLGVMLLLLAMPASLWLISPAQRVMAVLMGALLAGVMAAICWTVATLVPKGEYVCYLLALVAALLLRWRDVPGEARPLYACLVAAAWFWMLSCMVIVAGSWGGASASDVALACAIGLGLLLPLVLLAPQLWPFKAEGIPGWRIRGLMFGALLLAAAVVAALGGGAYIRERASTTQHDLQGRADHWQLGISMLETPQDWLFGKGAGRFVANHFFSGPLTGHTGDYRVRSGADGKPFLVLTGGQHVLGFGELFRVSQRISAPQGQVLLKARVRTEKDVVLHTEICEKHLLYTDNCLGKSIPVKAAKSGLNWQEASADLGPAREMGGNWYLPRFIVFSVALETTGGMLDIASLELSDGSGRPLLTNGDFSGEMAHWFFSSDKHHLPWHIKNLGLNVLFDSGLLGLALLNILLLLGLWRMSFGSGREHPLAPALAASLIGFLAVGLWDSLIDAPRIGFMFYMVLGVSLGLRALPGAVAEGRQR